MVDVVAELARDGVLILLPYFVDLDVMSETIDGFSYESRK